jgi:hypothetical protein
MVQLRYNEAQMSPTSLGGGYRFAFQVVSISPARDAWASSKLACDQPR